jgi:carbamoyl-phosphate synthase large subunit
MRSTGEVMGIDDSFGKAFAKAELGASVNLSTTGTVFVSMSDRTKEATVPVVRDLLALGFKVVATSGTQQVLKDNGIEGIEVVLKLHEGRPHVIDWIKNNQIQFIINTPSGEESQLDGRSIRRTALDYKLPIITTLAGARATVAAIRSLQEHPLEVKALQDYF